MKEVGRREGRERKKTDSPGKAFLRRWQVGTLSLKGSSGVKWWDAWNSIPGCGNRRHQVPWRIPDPAGASGCAAEEGMWTKWLGVRPLRLLATGRSLACMLMSEGFGRAWRDFHAAKLLQCPGFRKCRLGGKVPLKHEPSLIAELMSPRQSSALPAFLGSLSELLPHLFSAYQLLFILQSPSLKTPSHKAPLQASCSLPPLTLVMSLPHNRHPMQSAWYPSCYSYLAALQDFLVHLRQAKEPTSITIKKPWPSVFLTGGCPVSLV